MDPALTAEYRRRPVFRRHVHGVVPDPGMDIEAAPGFEMKGLEIAGLDVIADGGCQIRYERTVGREEQLTAVGVIVRVPDVDELAGLIGTLTVTWNRSEGQQVSVCLRGQGTISKRPLSTVKSSGFSTMHPTSFNDSSVASTSGTFVRSTPVGAGGFR